MTQRTKLTPQQIADCRSDLLTFSKVCFNGNFQENWHHKLICDTLEKVFLGEIKRLIINIPPRYSKTELAVINFMAWCLGIYPDCEFIHASYGKDLASKNAMRTRDLCQSEIYRQIFPRLQIRDDSTARADWKTDKDGSVYAAGAGGALTGYGAGKMRNGFGGCFPYDQEVETENGPMKIGDIVTKGINVRVWSYNEPLGTKELQEITHFWDNGKNDVIQVQSEQGTSFRCTPDHEILSDIGWIRAVHLSDSLNLKKRKAGYVNNVLSSESHIGRNVDNGWGMLRFRQPPALYKTLRYAFPGFTHFDLTNNAETHVKTFCECSRGLITDKNFGGIFTGQLGTRATFQKWKRTVSDCILHIIRLSAIGQIDKAVIGGYAVKVANLILDGARADKAFRNQVSNVPACYATLHRNTDSQITFAIKGRFQRTQGGCPSNVSEIRNLVKPDGFGDFSPSFVSYCGVENVYCLGVRSNHNFILSHSGAIVSNCIIIDDAHKPKEVRSDTIRQGVIDWFSDTLESRVNSKDTPIIVIMQRLHVKDLSGFLLEGGNGEKWDHLKIPAICPKRGALWPLKHSLEKLEKMRATNPYVFAGQYMQEPVPLGGGVFKTEWLKYYSIAPPSFDHKVITADTAQKTKEQNDYSVFQCWAKRLGQIYLLDQIRGKWEAPELLQVAKAFWNKHNVAGSPVRNMQIEDKASGTGLIQTLKRDAGIPVRAIQRNIDKVTRAMDAAPYFESGFVHLPAGAQWLNDYVNELTTFSATDSHDHDDQVDATCDAIDILLRPAKLTAGAL